MSANISNVDLLIKKYEKIDFVQKLKNYGVKLRYYFYILRTFSKLEFVNNSSKGIKLIDFIEKVNNPIKSTSVLNIITLINNFIKMSQLKKKINTKNGFDKVPVALKIITTFTSAVEAFNDVRRGLSVLIIALETSSVVSNVFLGIGVIGSIVSTGLTSRTVWKAQLQLNEFVKTVSYNKEGMYSYKDYKNLCNFFAVHSLKQIGKEFGVDGEIFYRNIRLKLEAMKTTYSHLDDEQKSVRLKKIVNLMKSRLEAQRNEKIISFVSSAVGLVINTTIIIASIANPIFILAWIGYNILNSTITQIYTQMQRHKFENKIGLIDPKVKEISKTYFSIAHFGFSKTEETV